MSELVWILLIILFVYLYVRENKPPKYGFQTRTLQGETVKSHSESVIADYLLKNNIRDEYERRIGGIGKPDFYLLDHDVYIEFWGLVDHNDNNVRENYVRTMRWKMAQYYSRNIKFISVYPRNLSNLDWIFKKKFEDVTGKKLH